MIDNLLFSQCLSCPNNSHKLQQPLLRCQQHYNRFVVTDALSSPIFRSVAITYPEIFRERIDSSSEDRGLGVRDWISGCISQLPGHSTLDIASLPIKNEARINELPGTKFKRINTSRKPPEGSFCVTMDFNG